MRIAKLVQDDVDDTISKALFNRVAGPMPVPCDDQGGLGRCERQQQHGMPLFSGNYLRTLEQPDDTSQACGVSRVLLLLLCPPSIPNKLLLLLADTRRMDDASLMLNECWLVLN